MVQSTFLTEIYLALSDTNNLNYVPTYKYIKRNWMTTYLGKYQDKLIVDLKDQLIEPVMNCTVQSISRDASIKTITPPG